MEIEPTIQTATSKTELEHQAWYWISHPHEGDTFYPVYVIDGTYLKMEGKHYRLDEIQGATFNKAVLPEPHHHG